MELSPSMVVEVASNSSAGFFIRSASRLIDTLLGVLVFYVGSMVGNLAVSILAGLGHAPAGWRATLELLSPLGVGLLLVGGVLYQVTAETVGGASLGKLLLGLRVTSENLTPCLFKGVLIRNTAYFLDALPLGVPAYRAMAHSVLNQRYGDQWGRTVVMRTQAVPPDSRQGKALLALGILSGTAAWAILVALCFVMTVR